MAAPRWQQLLLLAAPIALARATQAVDGFADALMVAPLGKDALTATTTGSLNFFLFFILPMGMCTIVQSFSAQLTGRGATAESFRYGWYGMYLAAIFAVIGLLFIPWLPALVDGLRYSEAVRADMAVYLQIRTLSLGGGLTVEALGNWYAGCGNTKMQMRAGLLNMVINIAANWLLIGGNLGLPALGVAGAAWSSVISNWLAAGYLVVCFLRDKHRTVSALPEAKAEAEVRWERRTAREFGKVCRVGFPSGLNWFFEFGAWLIFVNGAVSGLGDMAVAALNVVVQINSVSFMPAFGIATAGAVLAGQAIGDSRLDDVPKVLWLTFRVAAVWMAAMAGIYLLVPEAILALFAEDWSKLDQALFLSLAVPMLLWSAAWQLFDAAALTTSEVLRAAGDTFVPAIARIAVAWLVFIPSAYLAVEVLHWGTLGVMFAVILYVFLVAAVVFAQFRRGKWRTIGLTAASPQA